LFAPSPPPRSKVRTSCLQVTRVMSSIKLLQQRPRTLVPSAPVTAIRKGSSRRLRRPTHPRILWLLAQLLTYLRREEQ
jgi:hypothetical protein